jgi:Ca-activated chloride channel family protein
MINDKKIEVILDTRKKVITEEGTDTLDVLLRLRSHEETSRQRTPLAIALVIDRSGSMQGRKIEEARRCALDILNRMSGRDLVTVVVYDNTVKVALELMTVDAAKVILPAKLEQIHPGGTTALHDGWLKGAEILAPLSSMDQMCRVILLSDGQANEGIVDQDQIAEQVRALANAGVTTTSVGIGVGFNEELMTAIANAGQGNAWYGQRAEDLAESFDAEMSFLSSLDWRAVRVRIHSDLDTVKVRNDYLLNPTGDWSLPSIATNSEVWMAVSLSMKEVARAQKNGEVLRFTIKAEDADGMQQRFSVSLPELKVVDGQTYINASENELVARRFIEIEAADLQREARNYVKARNWDAVERLLTQIEERAINNPWLHETVKYLRTLMARRDYDTMEKELMYSARQMKNRSASLQDSVMFCMNVEAEMPAFLRKKLAQGRNTDSQS